MQTPYFDKINPFDCVNGKLRKLHRLIDSAYMEIYKPYKLKGSMVSILFVIGKRKGINQRNIAELLILDQSTMSRDIKKLVSRNLIIISKGNDSRESELSLSENGSLMLEEISPLWHDLHKKVETILGSYNIQNIDAITRAIQSNLKDLKDKTTK